MTERDDSFYKEKYGDWAGNPSGIKPDFEHCCEETYNVTSRRFYQCSRKRGHGPGLAYCKQHDPIAVKAKKDAREAAWREKWEREKRIRDRPFAYADALKAIADGHNDPRTLARETLEKWA